MRTGWRKRDSTGNSAARRLEILLIGVRPKSNANTIVDHLGAFKSHSRHRVHFFQNLTAVYGTLNGRIPTLPKALDLGAFDVLVIHYTNYLPSYECIDALARERIAQFGGLKVLFLQDEYREINLITEHIGRLGIDVLFTCVPEHEIETVYPAAKLPGVTKVATLTGFVPEELVEREVPRLHRRPIDVGYRARQVPYWLGELGQEKWEIVPKFAAATHGRGLVLDLSYEESDRLYGNAWIKFLTSCKATLGVESGASVFDFTGDIQRSVERYIAQHPGATFKEVQHRFFRDHEGLISLNQISPRYFEAAALRTAMVLYEGRYSGILEPWRHYVPLRKDFANIDQVVAAIKDTVRLQEMADRAYEEVACAYRHSYKAFIQRFDEVIQSELEVRQKNRGSRMASAAIDSGTWYPAAKLNMLVARVNVHVPRVIEPFRVLVIQVYRLAGGLVLGPVYRAYVLLVPKTVRDRLRPFIRKYVL